jgi:hypothetical protein
MQYCYQNIIVIVFKSALTFSFCRFWVILNPPFFVPSTLDPSHLNFPASHNTSTPDTATRMNTIQQGAGCESAAITTTAPLIELCYYQLAGF